MGDRVGAHRRWRHFGSRPQPIGSSPGALGRFGRIDTLVNNAGIYISKLFTDYTAEDYAAVVGVNLTGFFTLTQRVIVEMLKRGGGHIVNITTTLADYANFQRALGSDLAHQRWSCRGHQVTGHRVRLPRHQGERRLTGHHPDAGASGGELHRARNEQLPPVGHVGQVSDIVDGILFLQSSPFITGETLHIDGGQIAGH